MKTYLLFPLVLCLLISCSGDSSSESPSTLASSDTLTTDTIPEISEVPEGWIEVKFSKLTILLEYIEMGWYDMDSFDDYTYEAEDTAYFYLYPGDWMDDKRIQIVTPDFDDVQLYVQEVVNVAMSSNRLIEVPFCVLSDWKSTSSEWVEVKQTGPELNFGRGEELTTDTIHYEVEEFKEALRESCGEEWYQEIKDIETREDLPASEFTSQYNYKIVARNSKTGETVEVVLVFDVPTSC